MSSSLRHQLALCSRAFSRAVPLLLCEVLGKSSVFSRSPSTLIRGAGGKVWLIFLFSGRSRFRCGLASCHLFMAIVCFPVSQLKPDAGSPSQFKGESKAHPRAGLKAHGSLALLPLPCGPEDLLVCSVLSWKVIDSSGRLALNVVCRLSSAYLAFSLCKHDHQGQLPCAVPFTYVRGGACQAAPSNGAAGRLQQAGDKLTAAAGWEWRGEGVRLVSKVTFPLSVKAEARL